MLSSQLHFFFGVDADWTKVNLLPLFDWARDQQAAQQAWHGFLNWGRATRELLAEFMPYVVQTFDYLADLETHRRRFSEHLAWIAYRSPNSLDAGWIREYLRKAVPEDRKEWASTIGSILDDIDGAERRAFWDAWLRQYVELRLDSEIPIDDSEWRAVINWSLRLAEILPEMVEFLRRRPAPRGTRDVLYYRLHKQEDLLRHPEAFVDLLSYLLTGEERLYHDCKYILGIADKLLEANAPYLKLKSLAERLGELGCSDAQDFATRIEARSVT
jgi:hypothetical protein